MNASYTRTAIGLHWLVALGIIGTFGLGFYMADLPLSPDKLKLYSWHKWAGVTLFLLAVLRLGWRISHRTPPLPAGTPAWQVLVAHVTHWALYFLMLAIPVSGWLMSSAQGFPVVWFGIVPLPDLVGRDKALGELFLQMHVIMNYTLLALVVLHAAAALKHHFIDRDDILRRMLPSGRHH